MLDYSPLQSALALMPIAVPVMALSVVAPLLIPRIGLRALTATGVAFLGTGIALFDALGRQFDLCRSLCSLGSGRYWIGFVDNPRHCCHRLQRTGLQTGGCLAVNDATREIGSAIGVCTGGKYPRRRLREITSSPRSTCCPNPPRNRYPVLWPPLSDVAEAAGPQGCPVGRIRP